MDSIQINKKDISNITDMLEQHSPNKLKLYLKRKNKYYFKNICYVVVLDLDFLDSYNLNQIKKLKYSDIVDLNFSN